MFAVVARVASGRNEMKAVVYRGPYSVSVDDVSEPRIQEPGDATKASNDLAKDGRIAWEYKVLLHPSAA